MTRRSEYSANRDMAAGLRSRHIDPRVAYGNREGVCLFEMFDMEADYRLRHCEVGPELAAYVAWIGEAVK